MHESAARLERIIELQQLSAALVADCTSRVERCRSTRQMIQQRRQTVMPSGTLAQLQADLDRAQTKVANLEIALVSARRIGMAMGIVMASHHVTDEQAFDLLRQASQRLHRKLRDVAEDVIYTGALELP
jgi:hypothetical protein